MVFKKGQVAWNKGLVGVQTHSEDTKRKISISTTGKPKPWLLGRPYPDSAREKQRIKMTGLKRPWVKGWPKGKAHTEETRAKLSEAFKGEKSNTWKGGISIGVNYKEWKESMGRLRRNRKLNAQGWHTAQQWRDLKENYLNMCPCCLRKEPEIKLTKDHIIPLSRGGEDYIENIQPLCDSCNKKKHLKTTRYELQRI